MGRNANGNEYGLGVRVFMQTYKAIPQGLGHSGEHCIQLRGDWIETDSHQAADIILGCFGLDMGRVYDHYGIPDEGQQMTLDLPNIIATLAPHLLETATAIKAS